MHQEITGTGILHQFPLDLPFLLEYIDSTYYIHLTLARERDNNIIWRATFYLSLELGHWSGGQTERMSGS